MNLLPKPKKLEEYGEFLETKKVRINNRCTDVRIEKALQCFEPAEDGATLTVSALCENSEGYRLTILPREIIIEGKSSAGAFYAIQTLRQIFENDRVPCLCIEDSPGMKYRGFYHDVTRGKIPTLATLKKLVDTLAYYKMNSLQLYVEHTFAFNELKSVAQKNGCLTADEIKELDAYCYDNFIDCIPSIACFGHLYELLQTDKYRHLQTAENYTQDCIFWHERMGHHTIDPLQKESIEVIKSMIDQYMPLFRSDKFNICCDETFDLKSGKYKNLDTGKLYIDFVEQIVNHVRSRGKTPMMWGDILLQHPDMIGKLSDGIIYLNWNYNPEPDESGFKVFSKLKKPQIVCPGTGTWSRLVESIADSSKNILNMLELGYKYSADGMLNTNWGDYGNPCALELSMHGLVLGAAKAWNRETENDKYFNDSLCSLLYKNENAVKYLSLLDKANSTVDWNSFVHCYSNHIYQKQLEVKYPSQEDISSTVKICRSVTGELSNQVCERDEYRIELISAAEGLTVMAELYAKLAGYKIQRSSDTAHWLRAYRKNWLKSNKESELCEIEKMFTFMEKI